jgi:hypothetical protein
VPVFVDSALSDQVSGLDPAFNERVTAQLEVIEQRLRDAAVADTEFVTEAAQHIIDAGGSASAPCSWCWPPCCNRTRMPRTS